MEINFKFNIGDILTHKAMRAKAINDKAFKSEPQKLFVVGRHMDECPGGIQLHYVVRPVSDDGFRSQGFAEKTYILNEVEVELLTETIA